MLSHTASQLSCQASSIGSLQIVDLLLRFRADTEKATDAGSTPLGQPQGSLETQGACRESLAPRQSGLEFGSLGFWLNRNVGSPVQILQIEVSFRQPSRC